MASHLIKVTGMITLHHPPATGAGGVESAGREKPADKNRHAAIIPRLGLGPLVI
jgi:hypothetical protein